jgi:cleavage and polyadenylation specificity factor subunit 1
MPDMHALHQEILPASGVEFATSLKLLPSTLRDPSSPTSSNIRHEIASRVLCNVVVARSNLLRIFEVREEPAPFPTQADDERERKGKTRRGTEAVEGEVEMDEEGEGFVNIAKVIYLPYVSCPINSVFPCASIVVENKLC